MKPIKFIGAAIQQRKTDAPVELPDKETSFPPGVEMGSHELDFITQACINLKDVTDQAQNAILYKNMGWSPLALDAHTGTCLKIDFDQPQQRWLNSLLDLVSKKTRVSLAIRFEPDSRLFILKVNPGFGKEFLDCYGDWRSPCIARAGNFWENHFFVLPQTWFFSPGLDNENEDVPLSVVGPGQVVAVPPSIDPSSQEVWRWVQSPLQQPPGYPTSGLLFLLEEGGYISRKTPISEGDLPSWEDIYPIISRSNELMQALLVSVATSDVYYQTILHQALRAGFRDLKILQGLLWYAPHGEMWRDPEGLQKLSHWTTEIQRLLSSESLNVESGSLGVTCPADPPPGASASCTETAMLNFREKPRILTTPSPPENSADDFNFLASLASEVEQLVTELERQYLASTVDPQGTASPSPTPQKTETESE